MVRRRRTFLLSAGATKERVTTAFKIILSDQNVEGILVNILGGIMRFDVIAEEVVAAAKEVELAVPLEGANVELGKEIIAESGLDIIAADDLGDACAEAAVDIMILDRQHRAGRRSGLDGGAVEGEPHPER